MDVKNLKLIVLDVGGVLLDITKQEGEAYRRGFAALKMDFPFDPLDALHLRGIGKYNSVTRAAEALLAISGHDLDLHDMIESPQAEDEIDKVVLDAGARNKNDAVKIAQVYEQFVSSDEAKNYVGLFPWAKDAVGSLAENGLKLAIFSTVDQSIVNRDLSGIDVNNFAAIVTKKDVQNPKPDGQGIRIAMSRTGCKPEETAFVGDAQIDIDTAVDAKCVPIGVLSGLCTSLFMQQANPDRIFKDLDEMSKSMR